MPSIEDIRFDRFYEQASYWTYLLYQLDGIGLAVPLPNAELMSFVQVFDNRQKCRDSILEYNQKMVTLFAYSDNVKKWWAAYGNDIPHNLQQLYIFCRESEDIEWMNIYTGRFRSQIKEIFVYDQLDHKILYYALGFIEKIKPEFQGDVLDGLQVTRKRICAALSKYFDEESKK